MNKLTTRQREVLEKMNEGWELKKNQGDSPWLSRGREIEEIALKTWYALLAGEYIESLRGVMPQITYAITEKGKEAIR